MDVSGHNLQTERKDVNNFWVWPNEYRTTPLGQVDNVPFRPELQKWMRATSTGRIDTVALCSSSCKFTSDSVSGRGVKSTFQAAVFLDIPTGTYVLSFNSDIDGHMRICKYKQLGDGLVDFYKVSVNHPISSGYNELQMTSDNDELLLMVFGGGETSSTWVTLTDIKIREGTL